MLLFIILSRVQRTIVLKEFLKAHTEMRLIQQTPAWALHAYLRFLGLDYTTENTVTFNALGLRLPIIVDTVHAKTEVLAMNYLSRRFGNVTTEMSSDAVFAAYLRQSLIVTYQQIKRINGDEHREMLRVLPLGLNVAVGVLQDVQEFFCGDRWYIVLYSSI